MKTPGQKFKWLNRRSIGIILAVLSIGLILYDYFSADIFRIELKYVLLTTVLFTATVFGLLHPVLQQVNGLKILAGLIFIALGLFNFFCIALESFGYGFSGTKEPFILHISFWVNVLLLFWSLNELTMGIILFFRKDKTTR